MNDLTTLARDVLQASNEMVMAGIRAERGAMAPKVRALVAAYDRAKQDPKTCIPTYLEVLIESFRE